MKFLFALLFSVNAYAGLWVDGLKNPSPTIFTPTISGDLTLSGGGGVVFPATQVASAGANTLDDYEEGTWTPAMSGLTLGNGTISGTYTKIGRIVTLTMILTYGSTTSITGTISAISGLPFTSAASSVAVLSDQDTGTTWYPGSALLNNGATSTQYPIFGINTAMSTTTPQTWANTDLLQMSVTYPTN